MNHRHKDLKTLLYFAIKWKKWQKILFFLSCVVVFVTTYALILPAITLEQQAAENEAGLILDTEVSYLSEGYDISAPDDVPDSDSSMFASRDENTLTDDFLTNAADDLTGEGAVASGDEGTEDFISGDISTERIEYAAEDSPPLFNEYDTIALYCTVAILQGNSRKNPFLYIAKRL